MKQIRQSVFETNSSNTHSLVMCTKKEFEDFNNDKLFLKNNKFNPIWAPYPQLVSVDQLKEIGIKLSKDEKYSQFHTEDFEHMSDRKLIEYFLDGDDIHDKDYFHNEYLEYFQKEYTTPNGEKIVAFGQFGYDG